MGLPIAPRSAVEDLIMHQEAALAVRNDESSVMNRLTRKVTVRLDLHQYAALRLVADRYGAKVTGIAEQLFGAAALDAADLAGFKVEQLDEIADAEWQKAEQHQALTGDGAGASMAAVGIVLKNDSDEFEGE